jgi:hypothetical protein
MKALVLALLLPSFAAAAPWSAEQLKTRRGGFLEDSKRASAAVVVVRGGEQGVLPGERFGAGDALRTDQGTVLLVDPDGRRLGLAERSQLRFEDAGPRLRIGEVWVSSADALPLFAGEQALTVTGIATVQVHRQGGRVTVVEGTVEGVPGGPVPAGTTRTWVGETPGPDEPVDAEAIAAIEAWRAERFEPALRAGLRRDRLHLRVFGGILYSAGTEWGSGGLDARVRVAGPFWVNIGGQFAGRAPFVGEPGALRWLVVGNFGPRFEFDLPKGFFLGGGIDGQTRVTEECEGTTSCTLQVRFEPGVRGVLHGGILLGPRFGMDLQIAGGVARRQVPSLVEGEADTVVPDPQVDGSFGVFFRF